MPSRTEDLYVEGWERGLKLALEITMRSENLEDAKLEIEMMLSPRAKQPWKGRRYYENTRPR